VLERRIQMHRFEVLRRKIEIDGAVTEILDKSGRFDHVEVNENGIIVRVDGFTVIYEAADAREQED
jgi:hypothetical protein